MKIEIKIPAMGESISEAILAEWVKSDGDYVKRNENLLVLESDNVQQLSLGAANAIAAW